MNHCKTIFLLYFFLAFYQISFSAYGQTSESNETTDLLSPEFQYLFESESPDLFQFSDEMRQTDFNEHNEEAFNLRAAVDSVYELDSIYHFNYSSEQDSSISYRETYHRDNFGRTDSIIRHGWSADNNDWRYNRKTNYTYDESGNKTSTTFYSFDPNSNQVIFDMKTEYTSDTLNRLTSIAHYEWDRWSEHWETNHKFEYFYRTQQVDNFDRDSIYFYDISYADPTEFRPAIKTIIEYFNDSLTIQTGYEWLGNSMTWDLSSRSENYLNSDGQLMTQLRFYIYEGEWYLSSKLELGYDENGNNISGHNFNWNGMYNYWVDISKIDRTFDENDFVTMESSYYWNFDSIAWEGGDQWTYLYDGLNQYERIDYTWDPVSNEWFINIQTVSTHDEFSNLYSETDYKPDSNLSLQIDKKRFYFYSKFENSEQEEEEEEEEEEWMVGLENQAANITLAPNPAQDIIRINLPPNSNANYLIANINGRKILNGQMNSEVSEINIRSLQTGCYFIIYEMDGKMSQMKFIKQ